MGVDHGGFDVAVAQEFLDGADVVAGFEEVGGEAVAEGVGCGHFGDSGLEEGGVEGFLDDGGVKVMAAFLLGVAIVPEVFLGEEPLPFDFGVGVGVFVVEGVGQADGAYAVGEVDLVLEFEFLDVCADGEFEAVWEHDAAVFVAFSAADGDL